MKVSDNERVFEIIFSNPRLKDPWKQTIRVKGVKNKNNKVASYKRRYWNYVIKEILACQITK